MRQCSGTGIIKTIEERTAVESEIQSGQRSHSAPQINIFGACLDCMFENQMLFQFQPPMFLINPKEDAVADDEDRTLPIGENLRTNNPARLPVHSFSDSMKQMSPEYQKNIHAAISDRYNLRKESGLVS